MRASTTNAVAVAVTAVTVNNCSFAHGSVLHGAEAARAPVSAVDSQGWSYVVGVGADGDAWGRSNRGGGAVITGDASTVINHCVNALPAPGGGTVFLTSGVCVDLPLHLPCAATPDGQAKGAALSLLACSETRPFLMALQGDLLLQRCRH